MLENFKYKHENFFTPIFHEKNLNICTWETYNVNELKNDCVWDRDDAFIMYFVLIL